jgi:hypothetical protein
MRLEELNQWWKEKKVKEEFIPITKRQLFHEIKKDFGKKINSSIGWIKKS